MSDCWVNYGPEEVVGCATLLNRSVFMLRKILQGIKAVKLFIARWEETASLI